MFEDDLIAELVRGRLAGAVEPGVAQRIELNALGFPDLAAAEAFADLMTELGFTAKVREDAPVPIEEWEADLRAAGLDYDPDNEETGPFRSWHVAGAAEIVLDVDAFTGMLRCLEAAARDKGGFLCSLGFPS